MTEISKSSTISMQSQETGRSPLVWIPLTILLAAIAAAAYFFLMKPAEDHVRWHQEHAEFISDSDEAEPIYRLNRESGPLPDSEENRTPPDSEENYDNYDFDDGLRDPSSLQQPELDEFGEGIASIEVFDPDINGDGIPDRISKTRHENGTAHFHYEYKIELGGGDGEFKDITPQGFRTIEGADCSLQKLRFVFIPSFRIIKISREWRDTWVTPTMAQKNIYELEGGTMKALETKALREICNVSDLF
jgi:hypothetical protein